MGLNIKNRCVSLKSLKILLIYFIVISFFFFRNISGFTSSIWKVAPVLWVSFFIYYAFKRKIKLSAYVYPAVALLLLSCLTLPLVNSTMIQNSLDMLNRVFLCILYSITIICSIENKEELNHLWMAVFIGGVLASIYHIANVDLMSLSLSAASNNSRTSISDKIFVNTYAFQQSISFIAGVFCLLKKRSKTERMLMIFCLGLILFVIFLTGSRKSILAIAVFMFFLIGYGSKNFWKIMILVIALVVGLQVIMKVPFFYNTVGWRIEMSISGSEDISEQGRKLLIIDALNTGFNHPMGVGLDNSKYFSTGKFVYAHNNYLEFFADFGFLGALAYYGYYIFILYNLFYKFKNRNKDNKMNRFYIAATMMLIINEYYQIVYYNLGYHLLLGMISFYVTKQRRELLGDSSSFDGI